MLGSIPRDSDGPRALAPTVRSCRPGLGDHAYDLVVPAERPRQRGLQRRHLVLSADEAREAARLRAIEPGANPADASK